MTETITIETFNHLVELAALELSPEQAGYLLHEMRHQLASIRELELIPMDDAIDLASHGIPFPPQICPPLRPDIWIPHENPAAIIQQAPETDGGSPGYIVVPDIPHTTLV